MDSLPPKYLYRYMKVDEYCRKLIVEHEVSFTCRRNLNDPFDSKIHYTYDTYREKNPEYLSRLLDTIEPPLTQDRKYRILNNMLAHPKPIEPLVEELTSKMRDEVNVCGLLCFSEESDNLLLWAHYAKFHTGICLRFVVDIEHDFYQDLYNVRYSENVPLVDLLDGDGEAHLEVFKTKAAIWSYEKEWRIIRPDMIVDRGLYASIGFPIDLMDRIILGSQISEENKQKILDWVGQQKIEVVNSEEVEGEFRLRIPD